MADDRFEITNLSLGVMGPAKAPTNPRWMNKKAWKAYYRAQRVLRREHNRAIENALIYGMGGVEVKHEDEKLTVRSFWPGSIKKERENDAKASTEKAD